MNLQLYTLQLDARVDAFLHNFTAFFAAMPAETFAKNKAAVIAKKLVKDKTLTQTTNRFWREVSERTFLFDRRARAVAAVEALTVADVAALLAQRVAPNAPKRRKLSCQTFSSKHSMPGEAATEAEVTVAAAKAEKPKVKAAKAAAEAATGSDDVSGGGGDVGEADNNEKLLSRDADAPQFNGRTVRVETPQMLAKACGLYAPVGAWL
jgi:hypothetical protein